MDKKFLETVIKAAHDKKADRIVVFDLTGLSDLCQYAIICSGQNERQTVAICDGIKDECQEECHTNPNAIEGKERGNWVLIDYGHTIIHIFQQATRDYYALEQLWPRDRMKVIAQPG